MLKALSTHSQITLLIIPLYDRDTATLSSELRDLCAQHVIIKPSWLRRVIIHLQEIVYSMRASPPYLEEWHWVSVPAIQKAVRSVLNESFDVVHIFRLYMAPFILPNLSSNIRPRCHLDLDDLESKTRNRLADLYRANGLTREAQRAQQASLAYVDLERTLLPKFNAVFVCSEGDKTLLTDMVSPQHIYVLPNVVRAPLSISMPKRNSPFTFLFFGNLNYYPNQDAIVFFMEEVLPCLQQQTTCSVRLTVVGSGSWKGLQKYHHAPNWRYVGFVEEGFCRK